MGGGPSAVRRSVAQKSNTEFTSSLQVNLSAAKQQALNGHANGATNGAPTRSQLELWTTREDDKIFIPSIDFEKTGLAEEREQYEITVKLFFLPKQSTSCRCAQTREAVSLVREELHMPSIDLLIVSYPGISFDAEDEEADSAERETVADEDRDGEEDLDTMIRTWDCLEQLHDEGVIRRLGVAEFGSNRLNSFLPRTRIRPSVNQINVRDCCVVPKPLILYAKKEKIELLTHNDCFNILPRGTTRDILGSGPGGAGVLADGEQSENKLQGDVEPQYVVKYTAVVKNRGVIENKGYFALAELK